MCSLFTLPSLPSLPTGAAGGPAIDPGVTCRTVSGPRRRDTPFTTWARWTGARRRYRPVVFERFLSLAAAGAKTSQSSSWHDLISDQYSKNRQTIVRGGDRAKDRTRCVTTVYKPKLIPIMMLLHVNTRTGGGRGQILPPPPIFPGYLKNGGAQRSRFWHTCLEFHNTSCVQILTS